MMEIFSENFDLLGVNAVFHLIRLVVLLVVLYMQWRQWREGHRPDYFVALLAFVSLVFAELFAAFFYTSGILQHLSRPVSQHPFWGDLPKNYKKGTKRATSWNWFNLNTELQICSWMRKLLNNVHIFIQLYLC